jgi:hypothetical protein
VRQQYLNSKEDLLNQQLAAINQRDVNSTQMLADAKELHTSTETRASAVIKQEEDLTACTCAIDQREHVAEDLEEKLQEREGLDDLKLDRELESLASHESDLVSCQASLEVEWRNVEDAYLKVLSHELAAEVHEANLRTQAAELADMERPLAERQMWELVTAQKRLEDLQASRAGEAWRVWDFLALVESRSGSTTPISCAGRPKRRGLKPSCLGWRRSAAAN